MKYTLQDITAADAEALRDFADFLDGSGESAEKPKRPRSSGGGRKGKADTATNELAAAAGPMEAAPVNPTQTMPFAPPVGAPAPPVQMPAPVQQHPPASLAQHPPAPVQQPAAAPVAPVAAAPTWDDIRQAGAKVIQHPQYGQAYIAEMMTRYGIVQGQGIETLNPAHIPQFYGELAAIANTMP